MGETIQYWLLKVEPSDYSIDKMKIDKQIPWDGVRNYQAQKYLRTMKIGDFAFYFHTEKERSIVGVVRVCKEFYLNEIDSKFGVVDVEFHEKFQNSLSLAAMKEKNELKTMITLKQPRLSVSPVTEEQWNCIIDMIKSEKD